MKARNQAAEGSRKAIADSREADKTAAAAAEENLSKAAALIVERIEKQ